MMQIKQTIEDLQKELDDQISLLELHCKSYDEDNTYVARHIATSIRVLIHDTNSSHSLLGQLGMKNRDFFDSSQTVTQVEGVQFFGRESYLVGGGIGKNSQYIPYLDDTPHAPIGLASFDEWWNRVVLIVDQNNVFSRSFLVLKLANQAGGAHVDPNFEEKYYNITKNNLMGMKSSFNGSDEKDIVGIELAIVRQVGHEMLKTLKPNYRKKIVTHGNMAILGGIGGMITDDPNKIYSMNKQYPKVGRNDKCPCGKDIKYKKCHGK